MDAKTPAYRTRSGIELKPHYGAPGGDGETPGQFPFTRGRRSHAGGTWIQRELSGEGDAEHSNAQIHYLISKGQTGIDVIGDSPTQAMMDPDHPVAREAVGTQGVSLCRKEDYLALFRGVPFEQISISSSAPPVMTLAGLMLAARERKFPIEKLRGSIIQAPLYAEDCCYAIRLPVEFRVRMALDTIEFCTAHLPKFHAYLEDTYFFSESGLTPVEEMALGFVQIRHLTRRLIARGMPVDSFAPRIAILLNCGTDFFEEIAKIRATRRLFAKMMHDEFGARDPRSLAVVITSHTSGLSLTAQQPVNNIVRGSLQALSLVLAGVQAMEISAFDEAFRMPSREAHLIGLRTQQIIDLETGAGKVTDPLGGSYFVEALTDEMERRIRARVDEIEAAGDAERLCGDGYFKAIFHAAMEQSQRLVETGDLPVVGVNIHRVPDEEDTLLRDVAERKIEPHDEHVERIAAFKKSRDRTALAAALGRVREAAAGTANLVPIVTDALDAGATAGEIAGTMREGLGLDYDPLGCIRSPVA